MSGAQSEAVPGVPGQGLVRAPLHEVSWDRPGAAMIARAGWIALGIAALLWLAVFWATGPSHCTAPDAHHHISCQ